MRFLEGLSQEENEKTIPQYTIPQPSWQQFCAHGLAYKFDFSKRRDAIVLQLGKCICCQSHGPINFWK